jgi:hypothetical protein
MLTTSSNTNMSRVSRMPASSRRQKSLPRVKKKNGQRSVRPSASRVTPTPIISAIRRMSVSPQQERAQARHQRGRIARDGGGHEPAHQRKEVQDGCHGHDRRRKPSDAEDSQIVPEGEIVRGADRRADG